MPEETTGKFDKLLIDIEERVTDLCGRSGQNTSYPDVIKAFQELAKPLLKLRETQPEQQLKSLSAFLDQIEIPEDIPESDSLAQEIALKTALLKNQVHQFKDFTQAILQSKAQTKRKSVEKQLIQTLQAIDRLQEKVDAIQDSSERAAKGNHRSSDPDTLARFVRENISMNLTDPAKAVQANLKVVTALTNLTMIELKKSIEIDIAQAKWLLDQFLNVANWLKDFIGAGLEKAAGLTQRSAKGVLSAITDMSRALGNLLAAKTGQDTPEEEAAESDSKPERPKRLNLWSPPRPFVSSVFGAFSSDIAIKLGTANTQIYMKGKGLVLDEPSVLSLHKNENEYYPVAVGQDAKTMLGRTPRELEAIRPMRDGVIADFEVAEEMIKQLIGQVHGGSKFIQPQIIITTPSSATNVERRAIYQSALAGGGRIVHLIDRHVAAAVGAGLPIEEPACSMMIDLNAGTSEVSVLSIGGTVYSRSVRVGGDKMDWAILQYMRREHETLIGEMSAEKIKKAIGCALPPKDGSDGHKVTIRGRNTADGIPKEIEISEKEMAVALNEPVSEIIDAIKIALEAMPPEITADIVDRGIVLCGGVSLLPRLDQRISKEAQLPVMIAEDPLTCTVRGAGHVLENFQSMKSYLSREV